MQKILLTLIGYLLVLAPAITSAQQVQGLALSMDQPRVHRKIGFQYNGPLAKVPDCESILYYSVGDQVYAQPLGNALVGDKLLGTFSLPDTAQAFALVFKQKDNIDKNNDLGFVYNVYQDNQPILGTYASEAVFFGDMAGLLGIQKDYDKATNLYEKEFAQHPDQKEFYHDDYVMAGLSSEDRDDVLDRLKEQWQAALARKAPDDSLMQLYTILSNFDRPNGPAYKTALLEVYPEGILAAKMAANKIYAQPDGDAMITTYQQVLKQFPNLKPEKIVNQQQFYYIVAMKYLEAKNMARFQQYADMITVNNMRSSIYNSAAWPIAEGGNKDSLDLGIDLAKKSVSAALDMKKDRPSYYTQKGWDAVCQNNYGMVADTYAYLLFQQGKAKEALAIQQKAVPGLQADPDMNMRLVRYMLADDDDAGALEKAADFIKAGKGNNDMNRLIKEAYQKVNNTDTGFVSYMDGLNKIARQTQLEEVKSNMINIAGHPFTLKDLQGNTVSLDALKGKVVVVDFWATWCGPCKMSFPGMQLALNQYKDDAEVVFLFIDTWERQPTTEERLSQVKKVLADGGYSFHVLLDTPVDHDKSEYHTISTYEVTGIPTKFVLDKQGNIRFKEVGFEGDTRQLASELSMMIELAKKANILLGGP